jgi:hypothetical protein
MSDRMMLFRGPDGEPVYDDESPAEEKKEKQSQATRLLKVATDGATFWHTPDGDAFATMFVDEHAEHWPVRSKGFRRWLQRAFYVGSGAAANAQAVQDAIGALEGKAIFDGPEHGIFVRVAGHDGSIFIDLANPTWQAVEVSPRGWRIVNDPPVKFRRARAMLPLPTPIKGGRIADLRRFINVADTDWPLVLGWLVAALFPRGPYPLLAFSAEQGSGKSTAARTLRSLVDPNSAPLRCEPRDPRDLMIAANNGWLVALDNLSHLPAWLSDALCRLSTGGGFSTRTLYENDEETIFDAMRPVIVTGIEDVVTRGDLLDRSLIVNLPTIAEKDRRAESEFWSEFEVARPVIFGAVLTAVSTALQNLPSTELDTMPRMADFALIATAAEKGLGLERGAFLKSYGENRGDANSLAIDGSLIGRYIVEIADQVEPWIGTAGDLLTAINVLAGDAITRRKEWPKQPKAVAGAIKRLAPNLRRDGFQVEQWRESTGHRRKLIRIFRTRADSCGPCGPCGPDPEKHREIAPPPDRTVPQTDRSVPQPYRTQTLTGHDGPHRTAKIQPHSNGDEEECEWSA